MRSETARQWFVVSGQFLGGVGGALLPAVAGKRPVITYCNVSVNTVAAGQTVEVAGNSSSIRAIQASTANINTYPMGPIFPGLRLLLGEAVDVVFSGGVADVFVLMSGYYELG